MTACCVDEALGQVGDGDGFRPIGGERRRYRRRAPVVELIQLAGAVLLCGAVICGVFG
ncbi:hypothetical protein [Aurantimonas sp. 22II-16-19i]|uniref:hypothetical protein n=1 Tax=Aurantimonas sp. 22II-16-19i TaxID=1317114 RepID=UPI001594CFF9|nr:hypothetical protein [Aurantimonas sp. 22II-16-19i]